MVTIIYFLLHLLLLTHKIIHHGNGFFENLHTFLGDRDHLVIISNRNLSIPKGVLSAFKDVEYCVCMQHVFKIWRSVSGILWLIEFTLVVLNLILLMTLSWIWDLWSLFIQIYEVILVMLDLRGGLKQIHEEEGTIWWQQILHKVLTQFWKRIETCLLQAYLMELESSCKSGFMIEEKLVCQWKQF